MSWATLVIGCSGAHFNVVVRDARQLTPIKGASVMLYDTYDRSCDRSAIGGEMSRVNGHADVDAYWCGPAELLVAAEGYAPDSRLFDSCDVKDAIVVYLHRYPLEPPSDAAAATARAFMHALNENDGPAMQRLLADPETISLYRTQGDAHIERAGPIRLEGSRGDGDERSVGFSVYLETGCSDSWLVHVVRRGDAWRVASVAPGPLEAALPHGIGAPK